MVEIKDWHFSVSTAVGWLIIRGNEFFVTSAKFESSKPEPDAGNCQLKNKAQQQVNDYLAGRCLKFELPIMTQGTVFQQSVWSALETIPSGETRTYGQVANWLGSGPRAVGGACRKNPVAVIVPCHRVVAQNGPGGYAGKTAGHNMQIKNWLLQHEA